MAKDNKNERPEAKGPCWLVTAPYDADDKEMKKLMRLFLTTFPQGVVGHVLVVRAGVCVSEIREV